MTLKAPWTPEQVDALNAYQQLGYVHEFTCGNDHEADDMLMATADGWHCPSCGYKQDWCHEWMADTAKHPPNPLKALMTKQAPWEREA